VVPIPTPAVGVAEPAVKEEAAGRGGSATSPSRRPPFPESFFASLPSFSLRFFSCFSLSLADRGAGGGEGAGGRGGGAAGERGCGGAHFLSLGIVPAETLPSPTLFPPPAGGGGAAVSIRTRAVVAAEAPSPVPARPRASTGLTGPARGCPGMPGDARAHMASRSARSAANFDPPAEGSSGALAAANSAAESRGRSVGGATLRSFGTFPGLRLPTLAADLASGFAAGFRGGGSRGGGGAGRWGGGGGGPGLAEADFQPGIDMWTISLKKSGRSLASGHITLSQLES
jgi:hypothetical protein